MRLSIYIYIYTYSCVYIYIRICIHSGAHIAIKIYVNTMALAEQVWILLRSMKNPDPDLTFRAANIDVLQTHYIDHKTS